VLKEQNITSWIIFTFEQTARALASVLLMQNVLLRVGISEQNLQPFPRGVELVFQSQSAPKGSLHDHLPQVLLIAPIFVVQQTQPDPPTSTLSFVSPLTKQVDSLLLLRHILGLLLVLCQLVLALCDLCLQCLESLLLLLLDVEVLRCLLTLGESIA